MSELQQLIRREILLLTSSGSYGATRDIEEIQKQIKQLIGDVTRISNGLDTQQRAITELTAQLSTIESRIDDVSNRVATNERAISELSRNVGSIVDSVASLGGRLNDAEQGLARLDTVTNDLTSRASTLENELNVVRSDLAALNTRVTTELNSIHQDLSSQMGRLAALEAAAVTSVGQGLEKTGNMIKVIAGNGMWFNAQNQIQLDLSGQRKGVGFDGSGMIAKIDTNYFSYDASGNITLNSNISGLPTRTSALEAIKIDLAVPPLSIDTSGGIRSLRLLYDALDFKIVNQVLTLVNRASLPTFRFPLELDTATNVVSLGSNYRLRLGQWTGQLEYQATNLSWRINVTVQLMRVNDWLVLSFPRFSSSAILASGKFVINFVTGLSSGWQTGATVPSSTTDPLSTSFAAVQFINGSNRVDAFRILGVSEWTDGELEIVNYGGTYTAHTAVDWAPMTLMYPCMG
nr:sigma-1 protein [Mammalian orthoreovirus]